MPDPVDGGRLVLVRHAKSDYPWGVGDHDRPLNPRGLRDAPQIGRWLATNLALHPGQRPAVRVSTARRAQATWDAASASLSAAWADADVADDGRIYEADVPTLCAVVGDAAATSDLVVVVGHNPGLADLLAYVAADDEARRVALAKFPTSAIAVLEAASSLVDAVGARGAMRVRAFAVARGVTRDR